MASPAASPVAGGAIAVTLHGCPSDLGPGEFAPETCYEDETAVELALAGGGGVGGGDLIAPSAGGEGDGPPVWTGLPFGEYELRAVGFPPGYDRFFVPGLPGSGSGSGTGAESAGDPGAGYGEGGRGYRVRLAPETPIYRLDAYAFASSGAATPTPAAPPPATPRPTATPPAEETGSIAVRVYVCPGASLQSFDRAGCALVNNGFETRLEGEGLEDALTRDDSDAGAGGSRVWDGLPFGTYVFAQPRLPTGAAIYYVPESDAVSLLPDNSGYAVVLNEDAPEVALDVYNLAPLSLPAPAAPPAPAPPPAAAPLPTPAPFPTPAPPPPAPVPTAFPAPTPVPAAPAPVPVEPTPPPAPTAPPVAPPAPTVPAVVDTDGDSLTDDVEAGTYGTDPGVFDTDGDGVGDGAEIAAGTDPFAPAAAPVPTAAPAAPPPAATDSDGDGLADADEAAYGANPVAPDTDGDGFTDGAEVAAGSNPANSSSNPVGGG